MPQKKNKSNKNKIIVIGIIIICVIIIVVVQKVNQKDTSSNKTVKTESVLNQDGNLVIPVSDISSTAKFYTVDVDGTTMEILAIEASDGSIRTAFNTCQVCYSSGRGYYKQAGDKLVCQNCGNQFTADQVEVSKNGCNPVPIVDDEKTAGDKNITISNDTLLKYKAIFENWKTNS